MAEGLPTGPQLGHDVRFGILTLNGERAERAAPTATSGLFDLSRRE